MKTTATYLLIIGITFIICFLLSAVLTIPWVQAHWVRQLLVLLLMGIALAIGTLMFLTKAKTKM